MGYLEDMLAEAKKGAKTPPPAPAPKPAEQKPVEQKPAKAAQAAPAKAAAQPAKGAAPQGAAVSGLPDAPKTVVANYGQVSIYKVEGDPILLYAIPVIKPAGPERTIINTIKEAATRLITASPEDMPDQEVRREFYFKRTKEIVEASPELGVPATKVDFYADIVVREMIGYGLLDPLVKDDQLEEVMVLGARRPVYVAHRKYEMMKSNVVFGSDDEITNIISRIARDVNRRVDTQNPLLDARLPDGSRVNATIRPISLEGPTLTIRKFREDPLTVIDLVKFGTLSADIAAFLWLAADGMGAKPANVLVSGGTGSGKTSTLNALASFIPPRERVITMEDTAELRLPIEHWIRFETRPPGLEGTGEVTMDMLVKNALRMRPDRIIVGEIRHAEAFTLFSAMNTGHDGCLTGDAKIALTTGPVPVGEFVDGLMTAPRREGEFEVCDTSGRFVNALDATGRMVRAEVVRAMRRRYSGPVLRIRTASGSEIRVTPDHPVYALDGAEVRGRRADSLKCGSFVAAPRTLLREYVGADPEAEYWSGLLHGDGNILVRERVRQKNGRDCVCTDSAVTLTSEEEGVVGPFKDFVSERLGHEHVSVRPPSPDRNCWTLGVYSKAATQAAIGLLGMPPGDRSDIRIDNSHFIDSVNEFVTGSFDAEGHVDVRNNALVFSNANKEYVDFVRHALLAGGIPSRLYESHADGDRWYRLYVYGLDAVGLYAERFGFRYPKKAGALKRLLAKGVIPNTNVDIVPCGPLVRAALEEAESRGISQRRIARKAGLSQGLLSFLKLGKRMPSRQALGRLARALEGLGVGCAGLRRLAEAEVFWDRVVSVAAEDYDGFVYDLTVSEPEVSGRKPHNFVANLLLVGNCMGTVHANSASETLVRLMNPPMNVPDIMIGALDFVVVQQRIYDRRKGTIRRITEFAEVEAVLGEKPQVQVLYEWEPSSDTFRVAGATSKYLQRLQHFAAMSKSDLQLELERRKQLIERLTDRGIRRLPEVVAEFRRFQSK